MTLLKSDQANLYQDLKVKQTYPFSCLVELVTTNDSRRSVINQYCVISYTLYIDVHILDIVVFALPEHKPIKGIKENASSFL